MSSLWVSTTPCRCVRGAEPKLYRFLTSKVDGAECSKLRSPIPHVVAVCCSPGQRKWINHIHKNLIRVILLTFHGYYEMEQLFWRGNCFWTKIKSRSKLYVYITNIL